jgi:hypothetical protein
MVRTERRDEPPVLRPVSTWFVRGSTMVRLMGPDEGRPMGQNAAVDPIPPEAFLEDFPPPIRAIAERLRAVVRSALPDAIERVRPGWHLIGYDVPNGRRTAYACYIAPEPGHVHLGFEHGVAMRDPDGRLQGAGVTRQVRWVTLRPGDRVDATILGPLIVEAARVARLTRAERALATLDREPTASG